MNECLFCKIIKWEIPSKKHYEDQNYLIFEDVNPKAKLHLLIVPKKHIENFHSIEELNEKETTKTLFDIAWKIVEEKNIKWCQLQINSWSDHGQEIPHLHLHLLSDNFW